MSERDVQTKQVIRGNLSMRVFQRYFPFWAIVARGTVVGLMMLVSRAAIAQQDATPAEPVADDPAIELNLPPDVELKVLVEYAANNLDGHTDIFHNGIKIRIGGGGAAVGGLGSDIQSHKDWRDAVIFKYSKVQEGIIGHGSAKGTPCSKATDSDIVNCLKAAPNTIAATGSTATNNCQTDAALACHGCCLRGPLPITPLIQDSIIKAPTPFGPGQNLPPGFLP